MAESVVVATGMMSSGCRSAAGERGVATARMQQMVIAVWNRYWLHVRSLLRPRTEANAQARNGSVASRKTNSQPGRVNHWRSSCV